MLIGGTMMLTISLNSDAKTEHNFDPDPKHGYNIHPDPKCDLDRQCNTKQILL